MLHSWYCTLLATGFTGKLMVMYVHEPSLLTIICRGKTINGTWEEFRRRLPLLLKKYDFQSSFIEFETGLANGYVVSKTNSRSVSIRQTAYLKAWSEPLALHLNR
jgi:hypothetical protein